MNKRPLVLFIIILMMTMMIPQKQLVYAATEENAQSTEEIQNTIGAQSIERNNIVYTLYRVEVITPEEKVNSEEITSATTTSTAVTSVEKDTSADNQLLIASTELNSVETDTLYYYASTTGSEYLVNDKSVSTYYGGTKRVTLRQVTEWSYVDGVSATLESYSDSFTYFSEGSMATTKQRGTSVDSYNNMTYTYRYYVSILETVLECSASTTCTIYGEVY